MLFVDFEKKIANAKVPKQATEGAAGYDLVAATSTLLRHNMVEYDTGIAVAIPDGYVGLLFPRSSVSNTSWSLANSVGVIDSDYRGSIRLRFRTDVERISLPYKVGERIGQLVIVPCPIVNFCELESVDQTDRRVGGFGSTDTYEELWTSKNCSKQDLTTLTRNMLTLKKKSWASLGEAIPVLQTLMALSGASPVLVTAKPTLGLKA